MKPIVIETVLFNPDIIDGICYLSKEFIDKEHKIYKTMEVTESKLEAYLCFLGLDGKPKPTEFKVKTITKYTLVQMCEALKKIVTHNSKMPDTNESNEFIIMDKNLKHNSYHVCSDNLYGFQKYDVMHATYSGYWILVKEFKFDGKFTSVFDELLNYKQTKEKSLIVKAFEKIYEIDSAALIKNYSKQNIDAYIPTNQVLMPYEQPGKYVAITSIPSVAIIAYIANKINSVKNNVPSTRIRVGGTKPQNAGLLNCNLGSLSQLENSISILNDTEFDKLQHRILNFEILVAISLRSTYKRETVHGYQMVFDNREYLQKYISKISPDICLNIWIIADNYLGMKDYLKQNDKIKLVYEFTVNRKLSSISSLILKEYDTFTTHLDKNYSRYGISQEKADDLQKHLSRDNVRRLIIDELNNYLLKDNL